MSDEGAAFDAMLESFLRDVAIDGDLRVECTLKQTPSEVTELVYLEGVGGSRMGPYVRKVFPGTAAERKTGKGYQLLHEAQQKGARFLHLPEIHLCADMGDRLVVLMEYVQGRTLAEWVAGTDFDGRIAFAHSVLPQLCDALTELHEGVEQPVIHRDVTPRNIICTGEGGLPMSVVLVDLGISRQYRRDARTDTEHLGTIGYAAPEQFGYSQTDVRTDVYATGMTLAFCLLGHDPSPEERDSGFADIRGCPQLVRVVRKATAMDPGKRYASARRMRDALVAAFGALDDAGKGEGSHAQSAQRALGIMEGGSFCFCPNCGAILEAQIGFEDNDGSWVCRACGQQLYGDAIYSGNRYPGVMWYCDGCEELLNLQPGFDDIRDTWRCASCGYVNRIGESEID